MVGNAVLRNLFFLMLCILTLARMSSASVRCESLLSEEQVETKEFVQLSELIGDQNSILREDTAYLNYKDAGMEVLVQMAIKTTSAEKKILIQKIEMLTPVSFRGDHSEQFFYENPRLVLKLALYDEKTWTHMLSILDRILIRSAPTISKRLYPMIQSMPSDLKISLLNEIGKRYAKAEKINTNYMGPKRFLDALLSYFLPPVDILKNFVQGGASPLAAFDHYLILLRASIVQPEGYEYYSANDILFAAEQYQKQLADPNDFIYLTGSFPNGKAKLETSDVDVFISKNNQIEKAFLIIDRANNEYFHSQGKVNSHLESHVTPTTFSLEDLATINPLMILITQNEIKLMVFPAILTDHSDLILRGISYPEPEQYTLER